MLPVAFVVAVRAVAVRAVAVRAVAVRAVVAVCGLRTPNGSQQEDRHLSFRSLCPVYTSCATNVSLIVLSWMADARARDK